LEAHDVRFLEAFPIVSLVRAAVEDYGKHTMQLGRRAMKNNISWAQEAVCLELIKLPSGAF